MSDKKISELPAAGELDGSELLPAVQAGATVKVLASDLLATAGLPAGGTTGQVLAKLSDGDGDAGWADGGPGGGPEAFVPITPYLGAGWSDFDVGAGFYIDRERVYFRGVLYYAGGGDNQHPFQLPAGYRPTTINAYLTVHTDSDSTGTATLNKHWSCSINFAGLLTLNPNPDFSASPNFGRAPVDTVLQLGSLGSFRVN